jgi:PAS domain S-box-containing protein
MDALGCADTQARVTGAPMSNDTSLESAADEAKRLRRCLNDLVSMMALPAAWEGSEPSQVVSTLVDALLGMLRLAFVFARVNDPGGGSPIEIVRVAESLSGREREISRAIDISLRDAPPDWPLHPPPISITDVQFTVAWAGLGLQGDIGLVVAGSETEDFPAQTEQLLLDVAANHAAIALQHARLLSEQRHRANEGERQSRLILDNIPGLVALLSASGYVEVVNRQLMEYFGQTLEELRDWGTNGTVHPEDLPHVVEVFTKSITSGTPYEIVQRLRRADGIYRWIQNSGFPLHDGSGQIVRWCVLLTDIDDRKQAEDALRKSERQFRLLVDAVPALVWRGTAEGDLDYLNQRAVDYLGHTMQSLSNGRWLELVHPDHREQTVRRWMHSVTTGASYEDVYQLRRADGQFRWIQSLGEPFRDTDGGITQWYGVIVDIDDQKRAEGALRQSERESRLIVDSIPGLVVALTPAGAVEFVNRQVLEYFGGTFDTLKQWQTGDMAHPEDLPRVIEIFTHAIASGDRFEFEVRARRVDGVYRWFQSRGFPLTDTHGRIVRWYNLLIDIEERKRAETQLAGEIRLLDMVASGCPLTDVLESLCRFVEQAAANCHCGIYLIDWNGPTFKNAGAPTLPAAFNDPLDGLLVRSEIGPCARAACLKTQVIVADIESDSLWQASRFRDLALANGLRSCWSTPIYSMAGAVLGTFAIYQRTPGSPTPLQQDLIAQVTHIASIAIERTQSEAALKRSEAFLADGQRLSLTGSFSWRVATDEITWSEQLYRIYGIEIGTPVTLELIRKRVHPDDISLLEKMKMMGQAQDGDTFAWQYRLMMPDHAVKYLHAVAHAIRNQDGQLEYIAAVQDVTERRRAEEALAEARSELTKVASATSLGVLTAAIAHEVNQPLSGIITNAGTCLRMLDARPPNLDGARETARRTIRDGNRASEVITRLRALFSKREFMIEPLDLNDATREVIALSSNDLQRNRIVLQPELADDLPTVTGDRIQLQQVILNLIRNASDAMAEVQDRPRQLLVKTESEGAQVRVTVRDAGVGLNPQSLDSLFDAFYTTKSGGMGIGLFVSRSIIERHQGRLWAKPNENGRGATFSFSIPCAPAITPDAAPVTMTS